MRRDFLDRLVEIAAPSSFEPSLWIFNLLRVTLLTFDNMKRESHLGVYALINVKGRIALILKSRGPYTGSWDLPGGKIEFGESPIQALAREIDEEVGLRLLTAMPTDSLSVRVSFENETGNSIELHHIGVIFTCEVSTPDELRHTGDGEDASEARWFPLPEVQELKLTPFAHFLLKQGEQDGEGNSTVLRASR